MALSSLFKPRKADDPPSPWQPQNAPYPALFSDYVASPICGVFALWHLGVRPQWVFIGGAQDINAALEMARQDPDMLAYDQNGGLFLAWAATSPEELPGIVMHLRAELVPAIAMSPLETLCPIPEGTTPIEVPPPEERLSPTV